MRRLVSRYVRHITALSYGKREPVIGELPQSIWAWVDGTSTTYLKRVRVCRRHVRSFTADNLINLSQTDGFARG